MQIYLPKPKRHYMTRFTPASLRKQQHFLAMWTSLLSSISLTASAASKLDRVVIVSRTIAAAASTTGLSSAGAKRRSSSSPVKAKTLCRRSLFRVVIRHVRTCCHRLLQQRSLSSMNQQDTKHPSRKTAAARCSRSRRP
ncbi:hypothetical protein PIB30_020616 [Stylosanthes scabra]|uniref:Secreted protein n=1 Tax=Stylosanthes scabra TaxID=79078 RepID=A0ABU6S834_9FABA|nr:hypothetical protein [Stylosanthes scabra]